MSDQPEDGMSDLHQLFFETATELVQKLNEAALRLEKLSGDPETMRGLRRTVHTLKGDAAACGFRELSELSHQFEDVLNLDAAAAAASVPEIALRAADVFSALLEAYRTGAKLPDIEALRKDIASLAGHPAPAGETSPAAAEAKPQSKKTKGASTPKSPEETRRTRATTSHWSEYERQAIREAQVAGRPVQHVTVRIDPQCGMPIAARQMINHALAGLGEVIAIYPPEGLVATSDLVEAALASDRSADQIKAKCAIPTITLDAKVKPLRASARASTGALDAGSILGPAFASEDAAPDQNRSRNEERQPAARHRNGTPPDAGEQARDLSGSPSPDEPASTSAAATPVAAPAVSDNILRVDAERIDSVLNLVGELILAKSMLHQTELEFGARFPKDPLRAKFSDAMAFQGRVLNDLQRSVMQIRMVPVEQLFRRFPRLVRDVARQCGKEVELSVRGGQTDLDKGILDSIAEPLTHLVRNAIGHGIERADERVRSGKRPQGTLRLSAYHQGSQVVIEVADDGAGIVAEKVRQRAISQGLLSREQAAQLSETETLELILRPGFSTAETVTEISGRGVGLDIVQSVVSRLKGTVQIETAIGSGTTFRLRLPLTLAIIRALLFRVEDRLYALPLNAVSEIARASERDIIRVEQYEVLQLRNGVLPLLRMGSRHDAQGMGGSERTARKLFVLVINSGERKFGLVVDALEGEDELVIKALDDRSIATHVVSGASILGDGRVVLILNMIALMEQFTRARLDAANTRTAGPFSHDGDAVDGGFAGETRARGAAGGQA